MSMYLSVNVVCDNKNKNVTCIFTQMYICTFNPFTDKHISKPNQSIHFNKTQVVQGVPKNMGIQ